ncbi:MAG: S1C family serine protease [Defluviitaleaceae bacterium]|nr:S1C family serine protease [Defluviitaleaceae bacterium]
MKITYSFILLSFLIFLLGCSNISFDRQSKENIQPPNITLDNIETLDTSVVSQNIELRNNTRVPLNGAEIFERYGSAVFNIRTDRGNGSGFFITSSGIAVTNHHVMEGVNNATAILIDGTEFDITGFFYYSNTNNDLAIIQVDGVDFNYLNIGNSDRIRIGEDIFALGSPEGDPITITTGNISTILTNPRQINIYNVSGLIQFTASIYSGSSGGPLLNVYGEVIGINSFGHSDRGSAQWAIPINRIPQLTNILSMDLNPLPIPHIVDKFLIYNAGELDESLFGKWIWGDHYIVLNEDGTGYASWWEDFDWSAKDGIFVMTNEANTIYWHYELFRNNNVFRILGGRGNIFELETFDYIRFDSNESHINNENNLFSEWFWQESDIHFISFYHYDIEGDYVSSGIGISTWINDGNYFIWYTLPNNILIMELDNGVVWEWDYQIINNNILRISSRQIDLIYYYVRGNR